MNHSIIAIFFLTLLSCDNNNLNNTSSENLIAPLIVQKETKVNRLPSFDIKSIFEWSPLVIFSHTSEGLTSEEKEDLINKNKSSAWELIEHTKNKMTLKSISNDLVNLYYLESVKNQIGVLALAVNNRQNNSVEIWSIGENRSFRKIKDPFQINANDFMSSEEKLPDDYQATFQYHYVEPKSVEVSLHTWMEKAFEDRKIANKVLFEWDGEIFKKKIIKLNS